jgi:hypothetical protein
VSSHSNAGLPLPSKHEALLAEMLFAQMLCVPEPPLKPLAYSTLMVRALPPLLVTEWKRSTQNFSQQSQKEAHDPGLGDDWPNSNFFPQQCRWTCAS